ncbi:hypothetical protein LUZ61_009333 [Rhynchospora tenuis]|uniref:PGG domain-containing protein n=1 Tax=Rhynchospora tenuis TaxID=198213 RepID=A0AAD6EYJ5_9POAL|nr:hypothetical protein LUZ61_009333 [Rhynchospora tenuis]
MDESSQRTVMCMELLEAAINGHKNTLTQLLGLDVGESPDSDLEAPDNALNQAKNLQSRTGTGNTVLHILASNGHSQLAVKTYIKDKSLLGVNPQEKKSLLDVRNNTGETALHCAARCGHSSVISELIDKAHELEHNLKDTLGKKNRHGETVLHVAARHGHKDIVETLITKDLELAGMANKNGESPLYLATVEGHVAVVQLFVQHLCHREITSAYYSGPKRRTALHAAVLRREKDSRRFNIIALQVLKFIHGLPSVLHGRSLKSFFRMPPKEHPGLDMANELLKLELGTLAKIADIFGSTPLHYAASTGDARMARKLLTHDASLAYCGDSLGLFPIHVAAYMGHLETVLTILENNYDSWELLDQRGRNFLHVGSEGNGRIIYRLAKKEKFRQAFRYLGEGCRKDRDARRNLEEALRQATWVRDNEGITPLHIAAARYGTRLSIMTALLQKEWVRFTLTSLDNLALSNCKATTESYKAIYQHYKTMEEVWYAGKFRDGRLLSYRYKDPPEPSTILATKVQTIALGSVLIATVTFAAAFAPPGGYNSSDGTPVLGRKYAFWAFILADFGAFAFSFFCTLWLIFIGLNESGHGLQSQLYKMQYLFMIASIFTGLAFGLGLYVVLAPVNKGFSIFVLVAALLLAFYFGAAAGQFRQKKRTRNYPLS